MIALDSAAECLSQLQTVLHWHSIHFQYFMADSPADVVGLWVNNLDHSQIVYRNSQDFMPRIHVWHNYPDLPFRRRSTVTEASCFEISRFFFFMLMFHPIPIYALKWVPATLRCRTS